MVNPKDFHSEWTVISIHTAKCDNCPAKNPTGKMYRCVKCGVHSCEPCAEQILAGTHENMIAIQQDEVHVRPDEVRRIKKNLNAPDGPDDVIVRGIITGYQTIKGKKRAPPRKKKKEKVDSDDEVLPPARKVSGGGKRKRPVLNSDDESFRGDSPAPKLSKQIKREPSEFSDVLPSTEVPMKAEEDQTPEVTQAPAVAPAAGQAQASHSFKAPRPPVPHFSGRVDFPLSALPRGSLGGNPPSLTATSREPTPADNLALDRKNLSDIISGARHVEEQSYIGRAPSVDHNQDRPTSRTGAFGRHHNQLPALPDPFGARDIGFSDDLHRYRLASVSRASLPPTRTTSPIPDYSSLTLPPIRSLQYQPHVQAASVGQRHQELTILAPKPRRHQEPTILAPEPHRPIAQLSGGIQQHPAQARPTPGALPTANSVEYLGQRFQFPAQARPTSGALPRANSVQYMGQQQHPAQARPTLVALPRADSVQYLGQQQLPAQARPTPGAHPRANSVQYLGQQSQIPAGTQRAVPGGSVHPRARSLQPAGPYAVASYQGHRRTNAVATFTNDHNNVYYDGKYYYVPKSQLEMYRLRETCEVMRGFAKNGKPVWQKLWGFEKDMNKADADAFFNARFSNNDTPAKLGLGYRLR